MECSREVELDSDMLTRPRGGMGQRAGEVADGSDMTKKPRRGMGPSVVKASAGATFSTATMTGGRPTMLLEAGGMETRTSKVTHGTGAEGLLSTPAHRAVRPRPQGGELTPGEQNDRKNWSPDSMRSVGCPKTKRGSRKIAKGEAVTEGAAEGGAAVTLSVGSATRGAAGQMVPSARVESRRRESWFLEARQ